MDDMLCAVISSTTYDLPAHREAAEHACLREHFFPVMMEHQSRGSMDALQLSIELVSTQHTSGNHHEAADAAAKAYRLAWCDGPPFVYEWGIRQARENLSSVGEPEPADLPAFYSTSPMPELELVPTSLVDALALEPPLDDSILVKIIQRLPEDSKSIAALRRLRDSASSPEIRVAATERLEILDGDPGQR